jgi:hypothetical protein
VFLLNNLGVISWSVWALLVRIWPVLLIAVGIDLLVGRRSGIGAAIAAMLIIILFAGFFWTMNFTGELWDSDSVIEAIVHEQGRADEAVVHIDQDVGELLIGSLDADDGLFVSGEVAVGENERLDDDFAVEEGVIDFSLSSEGQQYYPGWIFTDGPTANKIWELDFSQDVLLDLDVDTGVGRSELDLTDLSISSLDVDGGVGEVVVFLPDEGRYSVTINAGVGSIEVFVPEGVAAEIHIDSGLGDTSVIGNYEQRGGVYYSEGFENADHTAIIYLDGGVGEIRVVEVGD